MPGVDQEVEEAKEVEEEGSRETHRERKALRAAGYVGAEAPTPKNRCRFVGTVWNWGAKWDPSLRSG